MADLRRVGTTEAEVKHERRNEKRNAENKANCWLASTHDTTHVGNTRNTTRKPATKYAKNGQKGKDGISTGYYETLEQMRWSHAIEELTFSKKT